jgi:hypothetical protein
MTVLSQTVQDFYLTSVANLKVINVSAQLPCCPDLQRKNIEDNTVRL